MMRLPAVLLSATALGLGLSACGSSDDGSQTGTAGAPSTGVTAPAVAAGLTGPSGASSASTSTSAASSASPTSTCMKVSEPNGSAKDVPCPTSTIKKGKTNTVTLKTTQGTFVIELDVKRAPITSNSFAYLTKRGFYDGTVFHRVVPGFVIQGGDPYATGRGENGGTGGPGYRVTEAPPSTLQYTKGVVAMAKGGTDASGESGSQFYVVTGANVGLPPEYALVGKVVSGIGAVDKIDALGSGDGPPSKAVTITKATFSAK